MPFEKKNGRERLVFLIFSTLLLWIGMACNPSESRIQKGELHLKKGRYFQALQVYRSLAQKYPKDPRVLSGLGRIYSVRRLTAFAGRDYLYRSLKLQIQAAGNGHSDAIPQNLRDLLWLLVAMGRFSEAIQYLQEPWINLEQLFEPRILIWRNGLGCLHQANTFFLGKLVTFPESVLRDRFLFLCGSLAKSHGKRMQQILQEAHNRLQKKRQDWCTTLSLKFSLHPLDKTEAEDLVHCKKEFPGNIIVQREAMRVEVAADRPPWQFTDRGLFSANPFEPKDPGRPDVPPWPRPRDLDEDL